MVLGVKEEPEGGAGNRGLDVINEQQQHQQNHPQQQGDYDHHAVVGNNSRDYNHSGGGSVMMEDLVPLRQSQVSRLKFPPPCPVFHNPGNFPINGGGGGANMTPPLCGGVVESAFLHLETKEFVYQVAMMEEENANTTNTNTNQSSTADDDTKSHHRILVPETALLFGKGASVWAVAPGATNHTAALVCNVFVDPDEKEPFSSVQMVEDGWLVHFVPPEAIEFREPSQEPPSCSFREEPMAGGASTGASGAVNATTCSSMPQKVESSIEAARAAGGDVIVPEPPSSASPMGSGHIVNRGSADDLERHQQVGGADNSHLGLAPCVSRDDAYPPPPPSSAHHAPEVEASSSKLMSQPAETPAKRRPSSSDNFSPGEVVAPPLMDDAKRQRNDVKQQQEGGSDAIIRHRMVLPAWMDAMSVKAEFYKNQGHLERATSCQLVLRGRAVDNNNNHHSSPAPHDLYFDIDGYPGAVDSAFSRLEEFLLGPMASIDLKCLLMHDVAMSNPDYYRRSRAGNLVYQRDGALPGHPWRWMMVIDFPQDMGNGGGIALVVGAKGRGVRQMQGATNCLFRVTRAPRFCVFVSGKSQDEMHDCKKRISERIAWARAELHGAPRRF